MSVLLAVALGGSVLRYAFVQYPALRDIVNLIESECVYPKVDINTAGAQELIDIPYIGEYTANNIVRYREEHGPFRHIEHIKNVKGIREKNYQKFRGYLKI